LYSITHEVQILAQSSRTFRIFVSSTIIVLKPERNALQEKVFPRLCEYQINPLFSSRFIVHLWIGHQWVL